MATTTRRVGPADHGRRMTLDEFIEADFEEGWLYELARGVARRDRSPGIHHGRIVRRIARSVHPLRGSHTRASSTTVPAAANAGSGCPACSRTGIPIRPSISLPPPRGEQPWTRWVPHIVVEVVSEGGEERDYVEKREEYLRIGVTEYWILDPSRAGSWSCNAPATSGKRSIVPPAAVYRTHLLPGPGSPSRRNCSARPMKCERKSESRLDRTSTPRLRCRGTGTGPASRD